MHKEFSASLILLKSSQLSSVFLHFIYLIIIGLLHSTECLLQDKKGGPVAMQWPVSMATYLVPAVRTKEKGRTRASTSGWTIRPTFDQSSVSWYNCVRSLTTSRNRLNLTLLYVSQYPHIFLYLGQFPELSFNKLIDFSRILSLFTNYHHIYRKWVLLVASISRKHYYSYRIEIHFIPESVS